MQILRILFLELRIKYTDYFLLSAFLALLEIEQHLGYIWNSEIHQNSESSWGVGMLCQINSIKNSSILDALLDD